MDFTDSDPDDLFATPPPKGDPTIKLKEVLNATTKVVENAQSAPERRFETQEAKEAALRRELEAVRSVNTVIEGVVESLDKAKGNMETVSSTITSASALLNTWIRILSQTEHNQRLLLNPDWHGASQDLADLESESTLKQQAAERREIEERMRAEAATRRAEDERKKAERDSTATGATRGRGRTRSRAGSGAASATAGSTSTSSRYVGVGGQGGRRGSTTVPRGGMVGSGVGRTASGISRGRGRAVG
ncbi:MAG: hypothetical protein M1814_001614 [Vezdaea aestivalis]|nr:MAG: hypothetical protein M1814_001614 [Vezdaea aestivalis]